MAGPGLGPRAEMSQIFFWTPGAHSSQRNTEADTGQVTEQRGPRGAQSALAASRGVLQAEVSRRRVGMEVTIPGCRLGKWFKLGASVSSFGK